MESQFDFFCKEGVCAILCEKAELFNIHDLVMPTHQERLRLFNNTPILISRRMKFLPNSHTTLSEILTGNLTLSGAYWFKKDSGPLTSLQCTLITGIRWSKLLYIVEKSAGQSPF